MHKQLESCAKPQSPSPNLRPMMGQFNLLALGMWSTYCGLMIAFTLSSSTRWK